MALLSPYQPLPHEYKNKLKGTVKELGSPCHYGKMLVHRPLTEHVPLTCICQLAPHTQEDQGVWASLGSREAFPATEKLRALTWEQGTLTLCPRKTT